MAGEPWRRAAASALTIRSPPTRSGRSTRIAIGTVPAVATSAGTPRRAATSSTSAVIAGTTDATAIAVAPLRSWSSSARRSRRRISSSSVVVARVVAVRRTPSMKPPSTIPIVTFVFPMSMARSMRRSYVEGTARRTCRAARLLACAPMRTMRVVVIGGGASGTLVAVHLLRRGGPGLAVTVVEPRDVLGQGVAFGTPDPWHRLNVPAITMSGLPEDLDHFRAFAGCAPDDFPSRHVFGAYLGSLLADASAASPAAFDHVRARATGVRDGAAGAPQLLVDLADGASLAADAVVIATGNELPRPPAFLDAVVASGDPRFVADPWASGSLDGITPGETTGIVGTGHTAIDLAASLLRGHGVGRVVALSRHGEIPRAHEDPWRPRPSTPAFTVEEFAAFADPIEEVRARFAAYPLGWRQALDSMRPKHRELWLAMDDATRHRFVREHRREWEIHRSRLAPVVARDVQAWEADGRLELRPARIDGVEATSAGLLVQTDSGPVDVGHLLLATGPDESPEASPLLAGIVSHGLARQGPLGLGIDVHPYDFRVRDAAGGESRPLYALGPIIRGSVWETIAVPEIRLEAVRIAEQILTRT